MTIVIGVYDDSAKIEPVRKALAKLGCRDQDIAVHKGRGADTAFSRLGFEPDEIAELRQELNQGRLVITAEVADEKADHALDMMREHGSLPPEEEESGSHERGKTQESHRLQEVEEEVSVGKRSTTRGVRVRTTVVEQPIRETVALRQERVNVEHHERDEALSPEEAEKALKPETVEMQETIEEAEVQKAARLIGEVNVSKTVETHNETINETVRKTEVEVERTNENRGRDKR